MRGERKREADGEREKKREKGGGSRERNFPWDCASAHIISARRKEIKREIERIGEFKKQKKEKKMMLETAVCGIGRVAGPYTRKYPRC